MKMESSTTAVAHVAAGHNATAQKIKSVVAPFSH